MEEFSFSLTNVVIDREKPYTAFTFLKEGKLKLDNLRAIKELMESKDYNKKLRAFERTCEKLRAKINKYTKHIEKAERVLIKKIESDGTLTEEQKNLRLQKEVFDKSAEAYKRVATGEGYKRATYKYTEFIKANRLMSESVGFRLKRTSPESMPFFKLNAALDGQTTQAVEAQMPSDCIYDHIEAWKRYVESGYMEDYQKALAEDERAKRLSNMQLEYLFSVCDTVCFHAEKGIDCGEGDKRFAEFLDGAYKTEHTVNYGMDVLRVYLKPSTQLKDYLESFKRFDRYHKDVTAKYAPYVGFADVMFLKDGKSLLSCLTHEGFFDVDESIKTIFERFEKEVEK